MKLYSREVLKEDIHLELSIDEKEVEFYVYGWFICSVEVKNLSEEARRELFILEE